MLQDMIQPHDQLSIDEISSPLTAQIFDFYEHELFQDTLQNSDGSSRSNYCYEETSSYTTNISVPPDIDKITSNNLTYQESNHGNNTTNTTTTTTTTTASTTTTTTGTTNNNEDNNNNENNNNDDDNNLSIIFDASPEEIDNDISASIDFSSSPNFSVPHQFLTAQQDFNFSSVQPFVDGLSSQYPVVDAMPHHSMGPPLLSSGVFEEDCLSSVPSYVPLNPSSPSCSFLGPTTSALATYMPVSAVGGNINPSLSVPDNSAIFNGGILLSSDLPTQEMDYQGDNGGFFCGPDSIPCVFNHGDLQLVGAGIAAPAPLATEISSLDDTTFTKVGKLSVEQRKEKIHRYMKKRNERNFSKKIKYACRKTLADSRPRVRGRFAKNDDFGETPRQACSLHEEDDEDEVAVKEEDDMVDSDIFAHISGVNSFKCSYPIGSIQSWI